MISCCLTIIFDGSFYIAVFERKDNNSMWVAKITLGTDVPKSTLIEKLILNKFDNLSFYKVNESNESLTKKMNPKRRQRLVKKQMKKIGLNSKSRDALQKQLEHKKKISNGEFYNCFER